MKRSVFLIALVTLGFWSAAVWAQEPKLNTVTFRVDGKTATCTTGEVRVDVMLIFSTAMRDTTPRMTFGLDAPYSSPVPFVTKSWVDNKTFVASFDINKDVPPTADGLYKFLVSKATSTSGDTMAPALSDTIKNSSDQPATLYISRQGKLTANPKAIDFDTTQVGIPKDQKLILKNVTCAEITLTQASVSAPFLIPTLPNGAKVAPDSSYPLVVRFDPFNRTAFARTLKLYYNSNQQTDSISVQLAGVSRGPELVFLPPPALKFDTVYVDSTASKTVRLTNRKASNPSLSDTLRITSIALKPDTIFSVTPIKLTMAPGDTQTVTVNFKPAEVKSYANTLEFVGNDFRNKPAGKVSFPVSGTGQEYTPPPQLDKITFRVDGKIATCTSGEVRVAVTLIFSTAMRDTIPRMTFGLDAPYSSPVPLVTKSWVDNRTFVASFDINKDVPPTADGLYKFLVSKATSTSGDTMAPALSDTIKNSSDQPSTLFISRLGKLTASTQKVDFDTMQAGQFVNRFFTIKNVTCANLALDNFTVTGPFLLINPPTGASIAPDSSLTLNLRFSTTTRKTYNDSIKIRYTSNQQQDSLTIKLAGTARGAQMDFLPTPALDFGNITLGDSATKTIRLTNRVAAEKGLSDTLKVTAIMLNPTAGYTLSADTLVVVPGDTTSVDLKFKPTEGKNYNSSLTFASNDSTKLEGKISFAVTGTGQEKTPPPQIENLIIDWPGDRSGYTNSDSLHICLDVDISQAKDVRWKFWQSAAPPASADDTTGTARFTENKCFKIPLRGVLTSGRWNCYVWLEGKNGVSGYNTPNVSVLNYDTAAPTFSWLPYITVGPQGWTGGFAPYTKADSIMVCWEASDSSGITEVRWKLASTNTDTAPRNPADTTRFGGVRKLSSNCVKIPLRGKLTQGRWYLYLWLIDGSGNSSHLAAKDTRQEINYDVTAPARPPATAKRNIPPTVWFNTKQSPLFLTIALRDSLRDAASVRWRFKTAPTPTTTAHHDSASLTLSAKKDSANFSVIFNSPNWCGDDTLYYWLVDFAGNADPANNAAVGYKFDMCGPVIARVLTSPAVGTKHTAFVDTLKITDHNPVTWDSVLYRFGGARANQPPRRLEKFGNAVKNGDLFTQKFIMNIPADGVTTRGVEFTAFARDALKNLGTGPKTEGLGIYCEAESEIKWTPVRVRTTGDGEFRIDKDGNAVPQPNGRDATNYTLFSVPFELDKSAPKAVLEDDLGAYDRKLWRFFEYRPALGANAWVEYNSAAPTISPFVPGRAFFLIVSEANKVIDSGAGKTVTTGQPDTLVLQEGWNLFGNPFNFPIHRDQLRLVNSSIPESPDAQLTILTYERGWSELNDIIEPWKGYAIYVQKRISTAPVLLVICPIATIPPISKTLAPIATSAEDWTIQISAKAGAALDSINYVGARSAAAEEYDDFDRMEPPVIGDYVSVYVDNEKWTKNPMKYTADFRPTSQESYEWPLRVNSNTGSGEVVLQFSGVANLPAGFEAYLVDEAYSVARNLRRNPEYRFVAGANGIEKSLKLLVGKPEALQKYSNGIALVPKAFELSQNFPNPFAAKFQQSFTAIRYTLPKSANVTVEVYNMLGQKVRTLVAGQAQAADYYLATWDGRDEAGKEVSSGVYVYRLLAESNGERFSSTKKLLLVK